MAESPDYKELLQLLNEFKVDYLIVGGFAVMKYGEPRYTNEIFGTTTNREFCRSRYNTKEIVRLFYPRRDIWSEHFG